LHILLTDKLNLDVEKIVLEKKIKSSKKTPCRKAKGWLKMMNYDRSLFASTLFKIYFSRTIVVSKNQFCKESWPLIYIIGSDIIKEGICG
jgi:hypothetical protein